jgi:hypothetical protein
MKRKRKSRGPRGQGIPRFPKHPLMTVCGKRGHPSQSEARRALERCTQFRAEGQHHRREVRVYGCVRCGRWHLTWQSYEQREERTR